MTDDVNGVEGLKRELDGEREKIKRLEELLRKEESEVVKREQLLNELYRRMVIEKVIDKEEISNIVGKQQYDSLSYHLAKEHEKRVDAEEKLVQDDRMLKADEEKLAEESLLIRKDEERIAQLEEELSNERKKRIDMEKELVKGMPSIPLGQVRDEFVDDIDLSDLVERDVSKHAVRHRVTLKDLTSLLLRINRMKAIDASIMLNTTKENVLRLS